MSTSDISRRLGTMPVYLTTISAILGAILFLRLGYAAGILGFFGVIIIIILGHLITVPTALAISEIATNKRVEGGGAYFMISRSFGLKIGSAIGITLFIAQAISVAFYTIAFAESFQFAFDWFSATFEINLPKQVISIPSLVAFTWLILKQGTGSGVKMLYIVNLILLLSLICFFLGSPIAEGEPTSIITNSNFGFFNENQFFIIFAICFPAFTGVTAGVGLSGDLSNPRKAIPIGTLAATFTGLLIYLFVAWKLVVSAPQADLATDQFIMNRIALGGMFVIPLGLAACTLSSAVGQMMIAPRTLQALANDNTFPIGRLNRFLARGRGKENEPVNGTIASFFIALVFVILGDINTVAGIISMFFLITYGILCLISFLNHFGAPPSYRPKFKSKWYFSLGGFLLSVWVMFKISAIYTVIAYIILILIYLLLEHYNRDQKGVVNIFRGTIFQLNRRLQVFMQKNQSKIESEEWRPAAICISSNSFRRDKVLDLMKYISYKHGFGTYFHYIEGYYSKQTVLESQEVLQKLISNKKIHQSSLYIDTMVSPSYTSAIAQVIQSPSITGMENNMVVFEFDKKHPEELAKILDNVSLVRAGNFDTCIFAESERGIKYENGIHVWIRSIDGTNANLMILLGYIIMAHPDWKKGHIKILSISSAERKEEVRNELSGLIAAGRLPITIKNIEIVTAPEGGRAIGDIISEHSAFAGLTIVGFREETIKHEGIRFFTSFSDMGDILFVNASQSRDIG